MYKNFEPHKFYNPIIFEYTSNKIELWQEGQMQSNDSFLTSISCIEENHKMKITFKGGTFNKFIDAELIFDKIFSLNDRLVLVTIPEESTLDVIGM